LSGSKTTNQIRIEDLGSPLLSPLQRESMAYATANPVDFNVNAILVAARARTGLSDFGEDDFLPRLQAWSEAADREVDLSPAGRMGIWREIVRFAATRLMVEDTIRRFPAVLETKIETPLVVGGLPRSGTTYLLQVLSADRRLRSLPYWEAVRPVAEFFIKDGVDTRHQLCAAECTAQDELMPFVKAIHEFTPDHISEDVELQSIDFGSYYLDWMSMSPHWRDYYSSHDQTPVYAYMRKMFQLLSWQRGPSRWVTKCPQHMEQVVPISQALPGSTIVINHRDPVASIQSAITGFAYSSRLTRKHVDVKGIAAYWIDRYERLLRAYIRDRERLDPAKYHDVYFHHLMQAPMEIIEQIYEKAGLEMTAEARQDFADALSANVRAKHGQLVYDLRGDFGLEPAALRERFAFYYDRFPVEIEVR
jgi:Sulfotransferase family